MQYPSWASARNNISYRRRTPEQSALYRLAYHYRDELERRWDELFAKKYGCLRPEVLEAFDKYLNCGILRFGTARAYCDSCKHSVLVAFSCKRRGVCDSCAAKRAVLFAENLHTNVLLHYPHRHLVFSLPKRLRVCFIMCLQGSMLKSFKFLQRERLYMDAYELIESSESGYDLHKHPYR